jgi:HlyD family secretion protein
MTEDRKPLDRRWIWWSAAVLVLVAVFFTVRALSRERLAVHAAQATHEPLESSVSTNGRIEPEVNYEFHAPAPSTVKSVTVQPGDIVSAGQLLMELDPTQARARLATAESGVKSAEAALESITHNGTQEERQAAAADLAKAQLERDQARKDLDALTKLQSTGAASGSEVSAARQRLDVAEASLRAAELQAHSRYSPAEVARAQAALTDAQSNLAAARQVVEQTSLRAPVAGTVYSINAGRTEFVEEGKLLLQMADLHKERVRAYFDEPEIGKLAVGQKVEIKWDAKPDQLWHGHIVRTPVTVIAYDTRRVGEVLVEIDDANTGLLPDTNVTVKVTTASDVNPLTIPRDALFPEPGKQDVYYVYKIVGGELRKTPVKTGTINLTQAAILSGLQEGDSVATGTSSGEDLQEGLPIKVVR